MTAYRIASSEDDYNAAVDLMEDENLPYEEMGFPTLLAIDGDRAVGLLSTRIQDGMIVAGPLVLRSDRRRIRTAIRLAEMYEIAMKGMGVTTFIFHTEDGSVVDDFIQRYSMGMKPYAVEGKQKFFIRRV